MSRFAKTIKVKDTVIESNSADDIWSKKSTRATLTEHLNITSQTTTVTLDFSEHLLFPKVAISDASCSLRTWCDGTRNNKK
jgi:hypothetical protein